MEPSARSNEPERTSREELLDLPHDEAFRQMEEESPEFKALVEEKRRQTEFFMECVRARKRAGLTQKDVAAKMGTTESAVSRLESYYPGRKNAPSLGTLQKYAEALGCRLSLRFEPMTRKSRRKGR